MSLVVVKSPMNAFIVISSTDSEGLCNSTLMFSCEKRRLIARARFPTLRPLLMVSSMPLCVV